MSLWWSRSLSWGSLSFIRSRTTTSRSIGQASVRELAGAAAAASVEDTGEHGRKLSFGRGQLRMALAERERLKTIVGSPAHSVFDDDGDETAVGTSLDAGAPPPSKLAASPLPPHHPFPPGSEADAPHEDDEAPRPLLKRILLGVKDFALSLCTPPTISLVSALVCALVQKLKAVSPRRARSRPTALTPSFAALRRGSRLFPSHSARWPPSSLHYPRHCHLPRKRLCASRPSRARLGAGSLAPASAAHQTAFRFHHLFGTLQAGAVADHRVPAGRGTDEAYQPGRGEQSRPALR